MIINFNKGDKLICSVCNKEFIVNEDTNYIIGNQPVCSWKCFLKHVKEKEFENKKIK